MSYPGHLFFFLLGSYPSAEDAIQNLINTQWYIEFSNVTMMHESYYNKRCAQRSYVPIFSISLFCLQCYQQEKCRLPQKRKNRDWVQHKGLWKDPCWEYCCGIKSNAELFKRGVKDVIAEYWKQLDPCSCWVISERLEMTIQKTSNRKMNLSSNLGWDGEQNESALRPAMQKTSDNLGNKGNMRQVMSSSNISIHISQPLRSGRIWHKVNF